MKKIKLFFKNLFRKGKPCIYCGLKTTDVRRIPGQAYPYRICEKCYKKEMFTHYFS